MTLARRPRRALFAGAGPVCRKEITHILRERATLFFALFIPVVQLILFGFAIDTNIRQVPTVVLDQAHTQESRRLLDAFVNTDVFAIRYVAASDDELTERIVSGKARVGIKIPVDFSRRVQEGVPAAVLLLVDGSDSNITGQALNVATGVALRESLRRALGGRAALAVEVRPRVLFNPGTRSPNFFVPGMIAIVMQAMLILLVALSIVRERERGTLDQLSLTPVSPLGLMVGKMTPYGVLGFLELCAILSVMRFVFQVPVHGSLLLLFAFAVPFILVTLGIGLLISTRARSQGEAFQLAFGTLLPSVFLSGYIFLIDNMPLVFQWISRIIPATYFIAILRGIILRGAGFAELWPQGLVLLFMGCAAVALAAVQFVRRVREG